MANTNVKKVETENIINVEELQKNLTELQDKVASLENANQQLSAEKEQITKQLNYFNVRYTRLFKLYANNLEFYLSNDENEH